MLKSIFVKSHKFCSQSKTMYDFKQKMKYLEFESLRYKMDPQSIKQLDLNEVMQHRIAQAFFSNQENSEQNLIVEVHKNKQTKQKNQTENFIHNSFESITIPFETNSRIRNQFVRFYDNNVRIGRLLEILDYMAATVAYNHSCSSQRGEQRSHSNVTLCVDQMRFFHPINADQNLKINAYLTYTGRSICEVRTDLVQKFNEEQLMASATFLMAARQIDDHSKSYNIPMLNFDNEQHKEICQLRFELESQKNLFKYPPTAEESIELHQLFLKIQNEKKGIDYEFIVDKKIEKTLLMHQQDKNLSGKVFGGHLMREAYEIGWLSAMMYSNQGHIPQIHQIDDVMFLTPVEIGSVVIYRARVVYVFQTFICVNVEIIKKNPKSGEEVKATELQMTFIFDSNVQLLPVYPSTYQDAMYYLHGKRSANA